MEEAVVIVGLKPADRYILACLLHIHDGVKRIILRARGRAISTACVVAERLRNNYVPELDYESVRIFTERLCHKRTGRKVRVTSIEIIMARKERAKS
ncbi:MAG: RNA-binding protein [Thermoprotei archaeon]|nr:MAG: RNA-binding protein [Thermoprotei archaeon]